MMGPITGVRPNDDRWGGEVPQVYAEAIMQDVMESDMPAMEEAGVFNQAEDLYDVVGFMVLQTVMRTAQRLAVELDGCRIDTSTIFDDGEPVEVDNDPLD